MEYAPSGSESMSLSRGPVRCNPARNEHEQITQLQPTWDRPLFIILAARCECNFIEFFRVVPTRHYRSRFAWQAGRANASHGAMSTSRYGHTHESRSHSHGGRHPRNTPPSMLLTFSNNLPMVPIPAIMTSSRMAAYLKAD